MFGDGVSAYLSLKLGEKKKDEAKIEPYVAPLVVTAKRDYVERFEV